MNKKFLFYAVAGALAFPWASQYVSARFYDNFNTNANWALVANGGISAVSNSELTLTSPANHGSTPTATLNSALTLTGTRQSILVRSHTGFNHSTVFYLWAIDQSTGNFLELKLDDINPTVVVAGYIIAGPPIDVSSKKKKKKKIVGGGSSYHFVGFTSYSPGQDGLYMAFRESSGITYWEISTDASTWTTVASLANPISTSNMTFKLQHKAYAVTSNPTYTVVDCFNYKAIGAGYHSLEDKNYSGDGAWKLYTEGFNGGVRVCCSEQPVCTPCNMTVNDVDDTQHFTDTSIPAPYVNQMGYNFRIISTDELTTRDYYNAYRHQVLQYVDADTWTYHLYFKYIYPQYIVEALEFPINKYTGSYRVQAAVSWSPVRDGTEKGQWNVWTGTAWQPTGNYQNLKSNWWYEVKFIVGLHDNQVFYSGFSAGDVGSLSHFCWSATYGAISDSFTSSIVPAMQMGDNIEDTTIANTRKDVYLAEWHIDWTDERLP